MAFICIWGYCGPFAYSPELFTFWSKGVPEVVRMCCMKLKSLEVARGKKSIEVQIVLRLYLESGRSWEFCCLRAPEATSFKAGMSAPYGFNDDAFQDAVLPPEVCSRFAVLFYSSTCLYRNSSSCCLEFMSLICGRASSRVRQDIPFFQLLSLPSNNNTVFVLFVDLEIFYWLGSRLLKHIWSRPTFSISCV